MGANQALGVMQSQVRATTEYPELSSRLANATNESFMDFIVETELSDSASAAPLKT